MVLKEKDKEKKVHFRQNFPIPYPPLSWKIMTPQLIEILSADEIRRTIPV